MEPNGTGSQRTCFNLGIHQAGENHRPRPNFTRPYQPLRRPHPPSAAAGDDAEQPRRPMARPALPAERAEGFAQCRPSSAPEAVRAESRMAVQQQRQSTGAIPLPVKADVVADPGGAGEPAARFVFSVDAKPFFPSGYMPAPQPEAEEDDGMESVALKHITGVMRHLTKQPEQFNMMVAPLLEAFASWLTDEGTVDLVITALIEQSIEQPNFHYTGAKLSKRLDMKYPSVFRTTLITKCRAEHKKLIHTLYTNPRRVQGFLVFAAELYKQMELVAGSGKRIVFLGNIVLDTMKQLVLLPTYENIKCVCQTLKLVGHDLDNQNRAAMNFIHQRLLEMTANPTVTPNVQLLTSTACDLRASDWGRIPTAQNPPPTHTAHNAGPPWNDGPVFYGPDGKMLTREESQFLQESVDSFAETEDDSYGDNIWEHDEEMDEEIQAAFQQFLTLGKRTTNR